MKPHTIPVEFALLLVMLCAEVIAINILTVNPDFSSALFSAASLASGFILMLWGQSISKSSAETHGSWKTKVPFYAAALILLNWMFNLYNLWGKSFPIDIHYADMLPTIKVMCERYLAGSEVYLRVPEIFNSSPPYLPAMWLPYILPVAQEWDMRLTNIILLMASMGIFLFFVARSNAHVFVKTIFFLLAAAFIETLFREKFSYLFQTEESVVLFYYTLLALAIYYFNPYFLGFAAALCLLSRYSLLFWFVGFAIYLMFQPGQRAFLIKFILSGMVTVLLLLTATSSLDNIGYFFTVPANYLKIFEERSTQLGYLQELQEMLGLRKYLLNWSFNNFITFSMVVNLLLPLLLFTAFARLKMNTWQFLGSAKICLTVFLLLVACPYTYLFYTPVMFSLISAALLLNQQNREVKPQPVSILENMESQ